MFQKATKINLLSAGLFISVCLHLSAATPLFSPLISALKEEKKAGGAGFFIETFLIPATEGFLQDGNQKEKKEEQKIVEVKKEKKKPKVKAPQKKTKKEKPAPSKTKKTPKKIKKKEETPSLPPKTFGGVAGDLAGVGAGKSTGVGIGNEKGVSNRRLALYFSRLRLFFQRRLVYPQALKAKKISGKVLVRFEIQENREILPSSIEIVTSSGYEVLDKQAIKILKNAKKVPKPPLKKMKIELPIVFRVYP